MDPEEVMRLLEGHKDIITPMAEERDRFYRNQQCQRCGSTSLVRSTNANIVFRGDDPIARYILTCEDCGCVFDPHSTLVLKLGNLGKLEPAIPILKGPED
jgi:hypothetical protein